MKFDFNFELARNDAEYINKEIYGFIHSDRGSVYKIKELSIDKN